MEKKVMTGLEFSRTLGIRNPPSKDAKSKVVEPEPEVEPKSTLLEIKEANRKKQEEKDYEEMEQYQDNLKPFSDEVDDRIQRQESENRRPVEELESDRMELRAKLAQYNPGSVEASLVYQALTLLEKDGGNPFAADADSYKEPLSKLRNLEKERIKPKILAAVGDDLDPDDPGDQAILDKLAEREVTKTQPPAGDKKYGVWADSL